MSRAQGFSGVGCSPAYLRVIAVANGVDTVAHALCPTRAAALRRLVIADVATSCGHIAKRDCGELYGHEMHSARRGRGITNPQVTHLPSLQPSPRLPFLCPTPPRRSLEVSPASVLLGVLYWQPAVH